MKCRSGCGACCIQPSIHTAIPDMPGGKPAGSPCIHLDEDMACKLFGSDSRPGFCADFEPHEEFCGHSRQEAMIKLKQLEDETGSW